MTENITENEMTPLTESVENQITGTSEISDNVENQTELSEQTPEAAEATEKVVTADDVPNDDKPAESVEIMESPVAEPAKEAAPAPVAEATSQELPVQEAPAKITVTAETQEEKERKAKEKALQNERFEAVFQELLGIKDRSETIEVVVTDRIRGGLRVKYQDLPMFLPASHFDLKRSPSEQSLQEANGKTFAVKIHELQKDDVKRLTVIVSRKQILEENFWDSLKVGDVIEGPVTSIASFGVFIDVYGVEGLLHISRVSYHRVDDLSTKFTKGQIVKAKIVEVNKKQKRIGLSLKEFEESPWKGISEEFPAGSIVKAVVSRVYEYGVHCEVKEGVEGFIKVSELSWTLRIKHPKEMVQPKQEIDVYVISVNEEKQNMNLSIKRLTENPWSTFSDKYPVKSETTGKIKQIAPQGCIININDEIDAFMPHSKMRFLPKDSAVEGNIVEIMIDSIDLEKESMIVVPPFKNKPDSQPKEQGKFDGKRRERKEKKEEAPASTSTAAEPSAFTMLDLLSDNAKDNLLNR
ncbi:MAG: 30S ribosomal protein S1 [Candidatus Kapabacteria bacterium]|nr:30S ribosomal protein S1 [Ignavibacteriota bacterium]MCW5885406.1 30S ribosomal protein S1 [Candidatus Kapabacteria bacterium]MCW5920196.1 30S ribosomal protein S1 [Bacteroidota bacterium]